VLKGKKKREREGEREQLREENTINPVDWIERRIVMDRQRTATGAESVV
jgi:hypothetical protein